MTCYQRKLPNEIIVINADGKSGQLIYDLITTAINELKEKDFLTEVCLSGSMSPMIRHARFSLDDIVIQPHDWFVRGFETTEECPICGHDIVTKDMRGYGTWEYGEDQVVTHCYCCDCKHEWDVEG